MNMNIEHKFMAANLKWDNINVSAILMYCLLVARTQFYDYRSAEKKHK